MLVSLESFTYLYRDDADHAPSIVFMQYDVREDEEQNVKLTECIDLLLAAGYFRARIKGLTPFDKVCKHMYNLAFVITNHTHIHT